MFTIIRKLYAKCHDLLLIWFIAVLSLTESALGQEVGLFRLRRFNGSVRFRYEGEKRVSSVQAREYLYKGTFVLRNSGFVISPNVINFRWSGELPLFLEKFLSEELEREIRGRFLGHNFTATFFQSSPNSLILVWNKNANVITEDTWGRTYYDINDLQVTLNLGGLKLPSRLHAARRDFRQEWDRVGFRASRNQLRRSFKYHGKRVWDLSSLEVDYDFFNIKDRIRSTWSYSRHTARIRYRRAFGKNRSNMWDGKLGLFIRQGISDYQSVRLDQSLKLQHISSPFSSLSSRYRHTFSLTRSVAGPILQNTASASLLHRLFASLSSNVGVGGTYSLMHNGKIYILSISGGINYSKRIPFSGRFQIGYTRGHSVNDHQIEATEQAVVNERHIFTGGLPIRLNERNIIVSTIVVFDESGEFVFEEGVDKDYVIRIIGDYVEIQPNPFGRIGEDDVVLVSYRFLTLPAMRYSTDAKLFNVGLNFGWLSLSYQINRHDQNLLAGDPQNRSSLQNLFTKTAQLQMTLRGENAGMSLLAEHKIYESNSLSFEAVGLRYAFFLKPLSSLTLSNSLTFSLLDHKRQVLDIKAYALHSELRWRPAYSFTFQGYAKYFLRRETIRGDESNFEYGVRFQRLWRVFRLLLIYEKRNWEFGARHTNERRFTIEIERIF